MNVIASMTWLKVSVNYAKTFYIPYPYIIDLSCSVTPQSIKVAKTILNSIQQEGVNQSTPLYSQTLINFYRVFTIAVKDIVWDEPDFQPFKQNQLLQFLRHIRNASAHNNEFFWGNGRQRQQTIKELPISWRGKIIEENLEHSKLYMDYMKPGDIFVLLADISKLANVSSTLTI
ncbi:MAG: hypothetical protein NTZ49_01040 [Candidatus Parcubacteria bacterium]|nr:hypothetical protein [Candidatus Parcubacteria bacterium]